MAAFNGIMHHLSMATCEWFLMFLMFIDAALGFILTKFAHHCGLQTPCLFCLRLDHVVGNERSYLSLFCNKHRAEVSSLISCELHDKLADVHELCDDCFMSIMKQNQYDEMGIKGYQKPYIDRSLLRAPSSTGSCSCCKRQRKPRPKQGPVKLGVSKVTMKPQLPQITGRALYRHRNNFKRVRNKISGHSTPCHDENNIHMDAYMDALSDSGCADLRFNSDSDFYSDSDSDSDSEVSFYTDNSKETGLKEDSQVIHCTGGLAPNQDQNQAEHSPHNESITVPLEVNKETRSVKSTGSDQDLNSKSDEINEREGEVSCNKDNGKNGSLKEDTRVILQDRIQADNSHNGPHNESITGPLEVNKETRSLQSTDSNQDLNSKSDEINEREGEASTSSDEEEGYESPGGSSVSEMEGESEVDKLKRQVEYDRERLRLLHKELEEERNAAAIAADEAMAMITRLQEEKAALHMEALQYLRMMDEQAEYDMEALDKANDLVTEKDKEIQDLEAELEYFRNHYEDELRGNTQNLKENHMGNGKTNVNSSSNHPVLGLEDEKKYILQSLSKLEKKFHQFSNGNIHADNTTNFDEVDVDALENEISDLNERLEALEADRDFLEHACNTLQSNGGLKFIQEIAQNLHDLRKIRFDRRCESVA